MATKSRQRHVWGEMVIHGEGSSHVPTLCSAARAMRYLQQGCTWFLAYVADTRVRGMATLSDVHVIWEFPDVFPEDFP